MINFKEIATNSCLASLISLITLFNINTASKASYITLSLDESKVVLPTDDYLDLTAGRIESLDFKRYKVKSRYSSTPIAVDGDTLLYTLYLDVYEQETLIGTRTHNVAVPKS